MDRCEYPAIELTIVQYGGTRGLRLMYAALSYKPDTIQVLLAIEAAFAYIASLFPRLKQQINEAYQHGMI